MSSASCERALRWEARKPTAWARMTKECPRLPLVEANWTGKCWHCHVAVGPLHWALIVKHAKHAKSGKVFGLSLVRRWSRAARPAIVEHQFQYHIGSSFHISRSLCLVRWTKLVASKQTCLPEAWIHSDGHANNSACDLQIIGHRERIWISESCCVSS